MLETYFKDHTGPHEVLIKCADWYAVEGVPQVFRWWNGVSWTDHFAPNPELVQPSLGRAHAHGRPIGGAISITVPRGNTASPGWYARENSIIWWDGLRWTDLAYPKKFGINWGGGSFGGSLFASLALLLLAPIFVYLTVISGTLMHPAFGILNSAICLGVMVTVVTLSMNAYYVKIFKKRLQEHLVNEKLLRIAEDSYVDPTYPLTLDFGIPTAGGKLIVDLRANSHCLLVGNGRAGMGDVLKNILLQLKEEHNAELIVSDPTKVGFSDFEFSHKDMRYTGLIELLEALDELEERMTKRFDSLQNLSHRETVEAIKTLSPIFLVLDTAGASLNHDSVELSKALLQKISTFLAYGAHTNIFVIFSLTALANLELERMEVSKFGTRVMLGRQEAAVYEKLFDRQPPTDKPLMGARGKGLLQIGNVQPVEFS